jgi:hypothetical protein
VRVVIAGGRGFLGGALRRALSRDGHEVTILTRGAAIRKGEIPWDAKHKGEWTSSLTSADAVVNASGYGLEHWPWSQNQKERFLSSRVEPGRLLAKSIAESRRRPRAFIQYSGINRYGFHGTAVADEDTPAADDFLARLTVEWEAATRPLEEIGVRHVVVRNAVVLHPRQGLFPLLSLPAKLFAGGRFGTGRQTVSWIHLADQVRAVRRLIEDEAATGAYNLIAPASTTNEEFMQSVCRWAGRPYWLHLPAPALRLLLGEMSVLILGGRPSGPKRLLEAGFEFAFPTIESALQDLLKGHQASISLSGETPT